MILKTNDLRRLEITFSNSILSARLISVLDFIWRSGMWPIRTSMAVKLNCRLQREVRLERHQKRRVVARAFSDVGIRHEPGASESRKHNAWRSDGRTVAIRKNE